MLEKPTSVMPKGVEHLEPTGAWRYSKVSLVLPLWGAGLFL